MTSGGTATFTGGCQCGAVRFAASVPPGRISICHCRMCQKATGAPFASLAEIPHDKFTWTKATPASFQSSTIAERDFCAACGTPLSYRKIGGEIIELMTGTFDRPDHIVPTRQFGTESRLGWVGSIANLPSKKTSENYSADEMKKIVSRQHPDHD